MNMHQLSPLRFVLCVAICALTMLPISTYAALNAGIVEGIWFSNTAPVEGEEVHIYIAVQNQSSEVVSGTVVFLIDNSIIGSAPFTIQSNDVMRVSIPYIFTGGDFDVSAYVTSAKGSITYTTTSKTTVSVKKAPQTRSALMDNAPDVTKATNAALSTGEDAVAQVAPVAEAAAQRIETFRDSLTHIPADTNTGTIVASSSKESPTGATSALPSLSSVRTSTDVFTHDIKRIFSIDGLALWKKATGVALSLLAFLVRIWYVLVLLIFFYIFWSLVRGQRIR